MDDFSVREAAAGDRDDVISIRDVYGGSDYLPAYYQHFMESKDITSFVLLHRNKIVGFCAGHIIDDGETVLMRAVRLSADYEGQGLYGYLDKEVSEWAKRKGVSVKAFSTSDKNPNTTKETFKSVNKLILTKKVWIYSLETQNLAIDSTLEATASGLVKVSETLLTKYITTETIKDYLFPDDRIIIDYVPFKLLTSNVRFMKGPENFTNIFSDVDNAGKSGLLSSGTVYPCKDRYHCTMEIFGNDETSLDKHIAAHLRTVKREAVGFTRMGFYIDKRFSSELLDAIFAKYGVVRSKEDQEMSKAYIEVMLVYEKKL